MEEFELLVPVALNADYVVVECEGSASLLVNKSNIFSFLSATLSWSQSFLPCLSTQS